MSAGDTPEAELFRRSDLYKNRTVIWISAEDDSGETALGSAFCMSPTCKVGLLGCASLWYVPSHARSWPQVATLAAVTILRKPCRPLAAEPSLAKASCSESSTACIAASTHLLIEWQIYQRETLSPLFVLSRTGLHPRSCCLFSHYVGAHCLPLLLPSAAGPMLCSFNDCFGRLLICCFAADPHCLPLLIFSDAGYIALFAQ